MSTHSSDAETPLFARFHDFCVWLAPAVEKFPRSQRFLLADRLLDTAFACHADLILARKVSGPQREAALLAADVKLETLRLQLRLAVDLRCISVRQYEHAARLLDEIGRMLGSWRKRPAGSATTGNR